MAVLLEHGAKHQIENPSITDVISAMEAAESQERDAEIQLKFGERRLNQPQLWLICVFASSGGRANWCVRFVRNGAKKSEYLATEVPREDSFVECSMCGCEESIRKECLLENDYVLSAARFFLEHGEVSDNWIMLDSSICFLD